MRVRAPMACLLSLVLCSAAGALDIEIDPGPVGSESAALFFDVPELVGVELAGQDVTLDFVLADHKHLEVDFGAVTNDVTLIRVTMSHAPAIFVGPPTSGDFFLGDENGDPVVVDDALGGYFTDNTRFFVDVQTPQSEMTGAIFHTLHFSFALQDVPGVLITSAELSLEFDFGGVYRVGEWEDMPEPGVLGLLGLAVPLLALRHAKGRRS